MKHRQIVGFVLSVLLIYTTSYASPQRPTEVNDHNCAGAVVSSLAGPGFGAQVASLAQLQVVDNLGLANCGDTSRQNP